MDPNKRQRNLTDFYYVRKKKIEEKTWKDWIHTIELRKVNKERHTKIQLNYLVH